MADLSYYAAKITECRRLLESSSDPLYRDVYQAMADEFAEKYEALKRRMPEGSAEFAAPVAEPALNELPRLHAPGETQGFV